MPLIDQQAAIDIAKELTITVEGYEMHNQAVIALCPARWSDIIAHSTRR